jgi:hypothetical protein
MAFVLEHEPFSLSPSSVPGSPTRRHSEWDVLVLIFANSNATPSD